MARGYSKDWLKAFLSMTAKRMETGDEGIAPVTPETPNECHWDLRDMLRFANLPHSRQPGDVVFDAGAAVCTIEDERGDKDLDIVFTCPAGICKVAINAGKSIPFDKRWPIKAWLPRVNH
jgi:hypothetical protein